MICPLCQNSSEIQYSKVRNIYDEHRYDIYSCFDCKIGFTKKDDNLISHEKIYKDNYDYDSNILVKNERIWRISKNYSKVKKLIKLDNNSNVLDIGCMYGFFLNFLHKEYKCNVHGLEIESFDLNKKKLFDFKIYNEDLFLFSSKKENHNKFDLIILNHTLEHFSDPIKIIENVRLLLKNDGSCFITVPNFKSNLSIISKKYWGWLQPAVHFFHFTPEGLKKIIKKMNFEVNFHSNQGGDSIFLLLTIYNFINNISGFTKRLYKRTIFEKIIIKLSSIFFKYMYYFGNDEIMLLVRKKNNNK